MNQDESTYIDEACKSLPHITVSSVIARDDKFLLVEELADGEIVFNQPSGHLEPRETPLYGTIRETLEETGWEYEPTAIIGIYLYHSSKADITYQRICFTGQLKQYRTEQVLDKTIKAVHWLDYKQIKQRRAQLRSPLVLQCVDDYLQGQRHPISLITNCLS